MQRISQMIPCLIKNKRITIDHHGFTLLKCQYGRLFRVFNDRRLWVYNVSSQSYLAGISGQTLQDGADIVTQQDH